MSHCGAPASTDPPQGDMHHQDFSGDPPAGAGTGTGSRKTAYHYRRGSSGAPPSSSSTSSSSFTSSTSTSSTVADDNPSQAGSSSPGLHQTQSQASGSQVKKKSGFQITSVTSAQVNVSGNNSLADDTESYDDMDESHTEDLSSSDMLDVSMSRATDTGVPERSSSDETLNSLHGVDTPGLVSPNEPLHPHAPPQGSQHPALVNGTMHHYYPQQHSQTHHPSDSLGGAADPGVPALPVAPIASSSPALVSKAGLSQRPPVLESKAAGGAAQTVAPVGGGVTADAHQQGSVSVSAAAAAPPGPVGFENTSGQVPAAGGSGPPAAATQSQHTQTQTAAPGSRFRVVKLDTNSEPFRKGRWTCTEYYEKEVPQTNTAEATKGAEASAEAEAGNPGLGHVLPAAQPPHTLQPYPQPSQDFTSPQAMQSPPQGLAQTTHLTYVSPQEVVSGAHMQKPVAVLPAAAPQVTPQAGVSQPPPTIPPPMPYTVDQHLGGYPAPQLHAGVMAPGSVRQPDFIQPTAPFQTQVQPPLPHVSTGVSIPAGPGVPAQPAGSIPQQLPHPGQVAPPAPVTFTGQPQTVPAHPQHQIQPPSTATLPGLNTQGSPYMPLTAVLQPLLNPGATFAQVPGGMTSIRSSQLEDAQKFLLQHQGLLGLGPRLGSAVAGEGSAEAGSAAGTLAQMGMSAEASAFMAAAAAGLRTQHTEGEDDSSSGASVVAIDNKIEQAMDLVKSHLMYAVREEVEVLKEQIKELIERNSQLEQENNLLKNLASPEQMAQFQAQVQTGGSPTGAAQPPVPGQAGSATTTTTQALPSTQSSGTSA